MDFSSIEETLYEHARNTKVRAPRAHRSLDVTRILSGAAVGAVTLCSMAAVLGTGSAMKADLLHPGNNAAMPGDQNAVSPSPLDRGATIEHKQPTRLADMLV